MLLTIYPIENRIHNNLIKRSCFFTRTNKGKESKKQCLWFEFPHIESIPADNDCDSYVIALLMLAMKENRTIIVNGSVSHSLLSNLTEFQYVWNKFDNKEYEIIDIIPTSIKDCPEKKLSGAICAFSGGVDSTFTVWRHTQKLASYRSQNLNLSCMVHGFDIPLDDRKAFDSAFNKAKVTLNSLNLDLLPLKTNFREVVRVRWGHAHATALVAALSQFKCIIGTCLIGSSDPYNKLCLPWGSSPLTDHLLGADNFTVIHDGSSHSRTEKVHEISNWDLGVQNLRVCWQGEHKDRNCGKCETCLRTKVNFLASGNEIPSCFPLSNNLEHKLSQLNLKKDIIKTEWIQILDYIKEHKVKGKWVNSISNLIDKKNKWNFFNYLKKA